MFSRFKTQNLGGQDSFIWGVVAFQESLPEIQKEHRSLLQELKVIQENEHSLQKDALSIKLKLEQIDGHISEHNSKIKYWQKEVSSSAILSTL